MTEYATLTDALRHMFTDDPVNWLKFALVFATLIAGYIIIFPIYKKVDYYISRERKRDIALGRGHVIDARLVKYYQDYDESGTGWRDWYTHATYEYVMEGQTKKYRAIFHHGGDPDPILHLYWINDPRRVFAVDDWHYENHKAIFLIPLVLFPWLAAALVMYALQLHLVVAAW